MLYIVATPLGNLGDISRRAIDVLSAVPVIACEDTRRTWALLSSLGIPRPQMISYREGVEERAGARLLGLLSDGTDVALCTDGGYPGISDPGFRLVRSAADADIGTPEASASLGATVVQSNSSFTGSPSIV